MAHGIHGAAAPEVLGRHVVRAGVRHPLADVGGVDGALALGRVGARITGFGGFAPSADVSDGRLTALAQDVAGGGRAKVEAALSTSATRRSVES